MSKKKIFQGCFVILSLLFGALNAAFAQAEVAEQAEKAFGNKNYSEATKLFEQSYETGYFTEKMLYRLAWLHEKEKNFPFAIYYLRKINQEFGGKLVEDKIRYLVQQAGGKNLYSSGAWDGFKRFLNRWALVIWAALVLAGISLLYLILAGAKMKETIRSPLLMISLFLFIPSAGLVVLNNFFIPGRAVIVKATSYYAEPGYAAFRKEDALSPGETVNITAHHDIWVRVEAGSESWWVPEMVVKTL